MSFLRYFFLIIVSCSVLLGGMLIPETAAAGLEARVNEAFVNVFSRTPTTSEHTYWKTRVLLKDKRTFSELTGALFYHKARGMSMPGSPLKGAVKGIQSTNKDQLIRDVLPLFTDIYGRSPKSDEKAWWRKRISCGELTTQAALINSLKSYKTKKQSKGTDDICGNVEESSDGGSGGGSSGGSSSSSSGPGGEPPAPPPPPPSSPSAPVYYLSSSGSDTNDGTSPDRPWKTLARANQEVFAPGTTLLLKRGDRWNEALIPRGNGTGSAWITVKPYGSEQLSKPTIDRQGAADANKDFAIKLVDGQYWRFEDLTITNSKTGFVYLGSQENVMKRGLYVKGLTFSNILGLPNHQRTPEEDQRPYWWVRGSTALSITGFGYCIDGRPATDENCEGDESFFTGSWGPGLSDVTLEDITVDNATYGIWVWGGGFVGGKGENYRIIRPRVTRARVGGVELSFVKNARITDPLITQTGSAHCITGIFGVDLNYTEEVIIQGGEVAHTFNEVYCENEGSTGINVNGPNDIAVRGVHVHHNGDSAFAIQAVSLGEDVPRYEYSDNLVHDNGLNNGTPRSGLGESAQFLTLVQLQGSRTRVATRNNRLMRPAGGHFITLATDETIITGDFWKDIFTSPDARVPMWTFCGNRDISGGTVNPPLVTGDRECQ